MRLQPAAQLALLLALCGSAAAQDACLSNPTLPECVSYTVHDAVVESDLGKLCASAALGGRTYSGWPAACTLWHECREGRGSGPSCRPLALLQTACKEAMLSPGAASEVCMTYTLLCAPQSVVAQCDQQPPLRSLAPAMQLHSAVQKLCPAATVPAPSPSSGSGALGGAGVRAGVAGAVAAQDFEPGAPPMACRECSAMSYDPDRVSVQALQANCPDPLSTLAAICLDSDSVGTNEASCASWAEFCGSEEGRGFTGLCGGGVAVPAPAPAPEQAASLKLGAPAPSPVAENVPAPPVPPLNERVPAAGGEGGLTGSSSGSSSAEGSSSGGGNGDATASGQEQGAAVVQDGLKQYLHASMSAMIVLQSWVPASGGAYVASCLAVLAAAAAAQALKAYGQVLEARWAAQRAQQAAAGGTGPMGAPGCGTPTYGRTSLDGKEGQRSSHMQAPMLWRSSVGRLISSAGSPRHPQMGAQRQRRPYVTRQELARNAARSLLAGATAWLEYMLVLVAVTFNLGLILSATLGFGLGALACGHWAERAAADAASAAASSSMRPTSENDVEVPYFAPALHGASSAMHCPPQQPQAQQQGPAPPFL